MNLDVLKARYEPLTKEIKNCKPNTLVYFHEFRHYEQDIQGIISSLFIWLFPIFTLSLLLSFININYLIIMPIVYLIFFLYLELDAWIYAFKTKYKRVKP